jgi:FMN phosphatase YigB (HAD superfamily)
VFSSESLCVYKPNGDFFTQILKQLSLRPDEVIYVGDSQMDDILGPSKVGIDSIWINRKAEKLNDGIPQPKFECIDLRGIIKILL